MDQGRQQRDLVSVVLEMHIRDVVKLSQEKAALEVRSGGQWRKSEPNVPQRQKHPQDDGASCQRAFGENKKPSDRAR